VRGRILGVGCREHPGVLVQSALMSKSFSPARVQGVGCGVKGIGFRA